MYNWSVDIKQLSKDKERYSIWKLEQMINFGLNNKKISRSALKKHWTKLNIDPYKKKLLSILLWEKAS